MPDSPPSSETGVLVTIGDLVEDIVIWRAGAISPRTDNSSAIFRSRGGSAANVAAFAAGVVATRFIGCVGEDDLGRWLVDELAATGTDVRVQRRGRTGAIVVLVDDTGERTMFPDRGAAAGLHHVDENLLQSAGYLHVPAYGFAAEPTASSVMNLIRVAGRKGIPVSMDASSIGMIREYGLAQFEQLIEVIAPAVLFANRDEADLLRLEDDRFSNTMLVIKDGPRPTVVAPIFGAPLHVDVPPIAHVRDSTGAGDAFAAGFLAALLTGARPRACVEAGHARARSVLQLPGAQVVR